MDLMFSKRYDSGGYVIVPPNVSERGMAKIFLGVGSSSFWSLGPHAKFQTLLGDYAGGAWLDARRA